MIEHAYKPLFPYFGGKSRVASVIWQALGDVPNYVEPFFGSGANLFLRPHEHHTATINDADGFVANFWRAVKCDPAAVAEHADNPVNECDLHARHLWLLGNRERITDRLCADPYWFDAKAAGWWCWGLCCWIGSGWCSGSGPWQVVDGVMAKVEGSADQGVKRQRPCLGDAGRGVNRKRPCLGFARGVTRQLPHLRPGQGVNRPGQNIREQVEWFAARLRSVRVCSGDWLRVCGSDTVTTKHGTTGVFLDPPYADTAKRAAKLYAVDCEQVAHRVREWCIENGDNPKMRIVLAGYEGEHELPTNWRKHEWKADGGYGRVSESGRANAKKERLWFSPHCLEVEGESVTSELFAEAAR